MSEVRRATLMPFGGGGDAAPDAKKRRTEPLSVRLKFVLPESTEKTCPIYNYKEELTLAKKRDKGKLQNGKLTTNGLDPFDDDDDDVKRIAMEMEAKYGTGPPAKKKRRNHRDDYADIGMGYDESDSFIDNTDGYDEFIPHNITTLHGGYYINCGALEFKNDEGVSSDLSSNSSESSSSSEDEDDEGDAKKDSEKAEGKPVNRKRYLESSESEGENDADKTDKAKFNAEKKHKAHATTNGVQQLRKKKEGEDKKVLENHKDKPPLKKVPVMPPVQTTVSGLTVTPVSANGEEIKKKKEVVKLKKDDISVVSIAPQQSQTVSEVKEPKEKVNSVNDERKLSDKNITPKAPVASDNNREIKAVRDLQLPANLPTNIADLIKKIKDSVQKNKECNRDVFNGSVNSLLISFERKSKVLGKQSRARIYQHMANLMMLEKENLCRRAKNLVVAEDTKRLNTLLFDLKAVVAQLMVPLLETYERDTQEIRNLKSSQGAEENKSIRMPKRKFPWTDETRKMLREIIFIKKRLLIYEGKTKESIEIHQNLFIKSDIQVIWPDGWMTMAALIKLCSTFDKKPQVLNNSMELNMSAEGGSALLAELAAHAQNAQNLESQKKEKIKDKVVKPKETQVHKVLSNKDVQKFTANSISITPIATVESVTVASPSSLSQNHAPHPSNKNNQKPKSDLPSNKIDVVTFESPRGLSISQISPPIAHKTTIQATRNIYKPDKQDTPPPIGEKTTKFVNLAHTTTVPENLTKKLSTDYNIDSIMSRKTTDTMITSVSASVAPPVTSATIRRSGDIIIPKEEPCDGSTVGSTVSSIGTIVPIENLMPRPMVMEIKKERDEDVIVLDDSLDDSASKGMTLGGGNMGELRRKPGPKCKTKFVDTATIKSCKSASNAVSLASVSSTSDKKFLKPDAPKEKKDTKNDGDDIFKLMENLKELNKMTTPSKSVETSPASAVSVIAFNKNFGKSSTGTTSTSGASHLQQDMKSSEFSQGLSFNDVYQRHFLNPLVNSTSGTSTPLVTAATKSYNSAHTSSSSASPDKHYISNYNCTPAAGQQAAKYKNYQQHAGTYMDDMLANFITDAYAYPKTANHKPKPTPK